MLWLTGRPVPDHKTIADFRKDNGTAIRKVCARFIALCRVIGLLTQPSVAIAGGKFKAVNSGVVGYNVQIAVEANHHLIVMHEVTND